MAILPMNRRMVDKQLGCCIFCRGVVGFVFKFCSNWTNFDLSTPFLMRKGGVVSVGEKVSEMVSGPTSLSLTLPLKRLKRTDLRNQPAAIQVQP